MIYIKIKNIKTSALIVNNHSILATNDCVIIRSCPYLRPTASYIFVSTRYVGNWWTTSYGETLPTNGQSIGNIGLNKLCIVCATQENVWHSLTVIWANKYLVRKGNYRVCDRISKRRNHNSFGYRAARRGGGICYIIGAGSSNCEVL